MIERNAAARYGTAEWGRAYDNIRALVQGLVDRVAEVEETNRNNVAIAGLWLAKEGQDAAG